MNDMDGDKATSTPAGDAQADDPPATGASVAGPEAADPPALRCRLNGERFHSNGVPPKLLKTLEGLFRDAVRRSYLQDNPERQRLPRGYIGGIDIKISTADGGDKTYVSLSCNGKINAIPAANGRHRVEEACDQIADAVKARLGGHLTDALPAQTLERITQLRNGLKESECIVFLDKDNQPNGAFLSSPDNSMEPYFVPGEKMPRRETYVRGVVTQVDQRNRTFQITDTVGDKLMAPLRPKHKQDVLEAFEGNETGKFMHVRGIAECDQNSIPLNFLKIKELKVTQLSDVKTRLDDLRALEDGWLDGEGVALSKQGLDWVEQVFADHYPQDLLRPYIYPTPEGGVLAEWHLGKTSALLEIDLSDCTGWWYQNNHAADESDERDLDLTDASSWGWMEEQVRMMERTKW